MVGRDRCPSERSFYSRSQIAEKQISIIKTVELHPSMLSAAEDLIAIEGNILLKKSDPSIVYVNSSKFLVQDNSSNHLTAESVKSRYLFLLICDSTLHILI